MSKPAWRTALDYALCNLRAFRLEAGLEEGSLARLLAVKAGEEALFDAAATAAGLRLPRT